MFYSNAKLYKIVCNETGECYIGSTCQKLLSTRLSQHLAHKRRYEKGLSNKCASFQILERGNYDIILLENFPCSSVDELRKQERMYIEQQDCINLNKPGRNKKENDKEYYKKNCEAIKQYQKEYRKNNLEKINARVYKKVECKCGAIVTHQNMQRHRRSIACKKKYNL